MLLSPPALVLPGEGLDPMDNNPYAPPAADHGVVTPPPETGGGMTLAEAEALRRRHLTHEARLQAFGSLTLLWGIYLIVGPPMILLGLLFFLMAPIADGSAGESLALAAVLVVSGLLFVGLGALGTRAASGLRRLDPQHRGLYSAFAGVWLLSFSAPALLGLWAIYLLHSSAGKTLLSPAYQEARRLTPHIQSERSLGSWLGFTLVLVVLPLAITLALAP